MPLWRDTFRAGIIDQLTAARLAQALDRMSGNVTNTDQKSTRRPVVSPDDLDSIVKRLSYREREIFKLRTGLGDGFQYTNSEVGRIFKISARRTSRFYQRACRKVAARIDELSSQERAAEINVRSVLEGVKELEPYLITHLKQMPDDMRDLNWHVFEQLVAEFFASRGYEDVCLVGRNPETAADIFAMRSIDADGTKVRIFVEVKRQNNRVGVEVVDRVIGAMLSERTSFGWHLAMIVSLSGFKEMKKYTPPHLCMCGVELRDGDDVRRWLAEYEFTEKGLWLPNPH